MQIDSGEEKIRVLVVDDSVLMSRQISNILSSVPGMEVIGRAKDGLEALSMVRELRPDVITMDVEMPRMNGITALKHIMVKNPVATVMISALTTEGVRTTFDALKYGAIDVIAKPSRREDESLDAQKADIIIKVRRAASIRTDRLRYLRTGPPPLPHEKKTSEPIDNAVHLIGIGTGTGGYYALLRIVPFLPANYPHVLVAVLLVASRYVAPFTAYLDTQSEIPVRAGAASMPLKKGTCYVCSGQDYLTLTRNSNGEIVFEPRVSTNDQASQPESAIDSMFRSLSVIGGSRTVGVVMSGAGEDGAEGLSEIRKAGGLGVVQDINNCMDPGMPLAALRAGAVDKFLSDVCVAEFIASLE